MSCKRCGGSDHGEWACPELKKEWEMQKQTALLEEQARELKRQTDLIQRQQFEAEAARRDEDREKKAAEKALKKQQREADPNYKSPYKLVGKALLWLFAIALVISIVEAIVKWLAALTWWQWLLGIAVVVGVLYLIGKNVKDDSGE